MTIGKGRCKGKRNARQFAAEVGGVALAVLGVVQDGVDVVKYVPLGDGAVAIAGAESMTRFLARSMVNWGMNVRWSFFPQ